jgi:carbamoyltransferase
MLVLGVIDSKPSAAAVLDGTTILSAVAEERLCRMKLASGVPRRAIGEALAIAGVSAADVDAVAIAQRACTYQPEPSAWTGWFEDQQALGTYRFDRMSASLAPLVGRFEWARMAHHALKRLRSRERLHKLPALLRDAYGLRAPISFHDHHLCHAASAYFTSGCDEALVITLDGGGDAQSGSVYAGSGGRLSKLAGVDSYHSLGNLYSYITALCGFRAEKHEGKITGLAAYGEPVYADVLRELVAFRDGSIRYLVPMYYHSAIQTLRARLPEDAQRADLAASVQLVFEEIGCAFVAHWVRETGCRTLALAGGCFANVKFNQRLHELSGVDRIFVHPAMDDGGLCVGAGFVAQRLRGPIDAPGEIGPLPNVYLGPSYGEEQIREALREEGLEVRRDPDIHGSIAKHLAEGRVVARFEGRMEYGPRALGHRSILFQTTDPSVNDWLNDRLGRTEFMPFAPATLAEHAGTCYRNLEGAEDSARFMTVTFECTDAMKRQSPGVVHVDGTARPQLVDAETAPDLHGILTAYHRRTGIPSLVNTSFNMHEEPIVCSPRDAIRAFRLGNLDHLAIGSYLIEHSGIAGAAGSQARVASRGRHG